MSTVVRPTNTFFFKHQIVKPIAYCQGFAELSTMDPKWHICSLSDGIASGACWGDEGGPVVFINALGGFAILAITSYQPFLCPKSVDYPSRHTKVNAYLPWLAGFFHIDGFSSTGSGTGTSAVTGAGSTTEGVTGDGNEGGSGGTTERTTVGGPVPTAGGPEGACDLKRLVQKKLQMNKKNKKGKKAAKKESRNKPKKAGKKTQM